MSANALFACYDNHFPVDGADFDGTNDYMLRGADLTGVQDGKYGLLSLWVRLDGGDGTLMRLIGNGSYFTVERTASNIFQIVGKRSSGATVLNMESSGTYTSGASWIHLLAAWNLSTGQAQLYINDADDLNAGTVVATDVDIAYSSATTNFSIGSDTVGNNKLNGCLAEVLFYAPLSATAPGDISTGFRRRFISASRHPAPIVADGYIAELLYPVIYLHLADGEVVANFATNRAAGGNFSITGALGTASTSPSD